MANISVTAADVQKTETSSLAEGTAGATITAGQPLYKDAADANSLKPGIATSLAAASCVGISIHGASDGQPIKYVKRGNMTFNAVLTVGQIYVVSGTAAGAIAPAADLGSGNFTTVLGIATTTTNLSLSIASGGVAKP